MPRPTASSPIPSFTTIVVTGLLLGISITSVVLANEILMILFLGVLFGIMLTKLRNIVAEKCHLRPTTSLMLVLTAFLLVVAAGGLVFFIQINSQAEKISKQLDEGVAELSGFVKRYPLGRTLIGSVPLLSNALNVTDDSPAATTSNADDSDQDDSDQKTSQSKTSIPMSAMKAPVEKLTSGITQLFQTTFGVLVNGLLIFFVGLFLASSPGIYVRGTVKLFPPRYRPRVDQLLTELGDTLWRWLLGRFATMTVTGVGAFLVLIAIGVPMATTLGITTALLCFVPNIGAAIALLLAMLCALPQGLTETGLVLVGYIALQLVESYVITPLIQQRQVALPPALLIAFQAFMGVLLGFIGAAIASPLLAVITTTTEMLYIQDFLGDDTDATTDR